MVVVILLRSMVMSLQHLPILPLTVVSLAQVILQLSLRSKYTTRVLLSFPQLLLVLSLMVTSTMIVKCMSGQTTSMEKRKTKERLILPIPRL